MAKKNGSVDPSKFLDERFELFSIPAFDKNETEILYGREIGSQKQIVQKNDILLSKIIPHIRRAWVVSESKGYRQIASGEWIVFRGEEIFPNFLKHLLTCNIFHAQFMQTVSGVGGSLLRARPAHVAELKIPFPPLAKQKTIATILDKVRVIETNREQAFAKLNQLSESIFNEMFVKNVNPNRVTSVKEICELKYGKPLPSQLRIDGDFNVYGSNGIVGTHIDPITEGRTIIIGRKGSYGEINFSQNSCYPIDTTYYIDKTATKQNLVWLMFALKRLGLNVMNKSAAVPGLSREDAYRQIIEVPSIDRQNEFEIIIKRIENIKACNEKYLLSHKKLSNSLQDQIFAKGFDA